ncbi:MAG: pyridoxal phosphate-dependent aminotransferase [Eubacterium sp.]|nr:pyridoxal phosphate-dependent aminotransferase [Eubacterium sp.]
MKEKNLDFDTVLDRKNTYCLKYDFAKRRGYPEDVLPMWVADMDFKTSSFVQEAIEKSNSFGVYGYTETYETYYETVKNWMQSQYSWEVEDSRWIIKTPGIVFALGVAVQAYSEQGDSVLILQPVYYPFTEIIVDNDRRLVVSNLVEPDESGRYSIDFEDFEKKIIENNVKIFLLSNPHNPGGIVWKEEELRQIADICIKHNVIIVSDEIHADFIWHGRHHVLVDLDRKYRDYVVTCTSPTKTFNIAGLQISNIIIPDGKLRKKFKKKLDAFGYSQANLFGILACEAAYNYGNEWLSEVKRYILSNIEYTRSFIEENLPGVKMYEPEGTYLVWLDFRGTGLDDTEINRKIIYEAKIWLDAGNIFGESGKGFQRINVACPRSILTEALERLRSSFGEKTSERK